MDNINNAEKLVNPFVFYFYEEPCNNDSRCVRNEKQSSELVVLDKAQVQCNTPGQSNSVEIIPRMPQTIRNQETLSAADRNCQPSAFDYAQYIVKTIPFRKYKGILYFYREGCYHQMDSNKLIHIIMTLCGQQMMERGSCYFVRQVAEAVASLPEIYCEELPCYPDLIPFPNGLLNINTMQFFKPDPNIFVRYTVSVPFSRNQLDCPVFCNFLDTVTAGNPLMKQRLLEIIGYLLSAHNDAKKFFVFVGVSNSGKSVLIRLIQSLLTDESVYSADMNALGDKFTTGYMNGAQLCVFADMPSTRISDEAVGIIKALTGGDIVIGERKYQTPEKIMNTTRLLFSSNHRISTSSEDAAFMNRCCIVPFLVGILAECQNPMLFEQLLDERQAIVNLAIQAYRQMRLSHSGMAVEFTGEAFAQSLYQQYCLSLQSVVGDCGSIYTQFIAKACEPSDDGKTTTNELYYAYCNFCRRWNYSIDPYNSFSCKISGYLKQFSRCKIRTENGQINGYIGIRVKY